MTFFEKLEARVRQANTLVCIGLDPRAEAAAQARDECLRLIDAVHPYAAAFKPNSAFYEVFGGEGLEVLRQVIAHVPQAIPVILDAKRGDIADTSAAYARAAFETLGASAITVSPYAGGEGLAPFMANPERGVFVLCKMSNPGADEFQALETGKGALFEVIARHAQAWNTRGNVGLVVGATDPARVGRVRELVPELWFLIAGIGAQGGDLEATLRAGLRADGMGLLLNAARSIASAPNPADAARSLRDAINHHRPPSPSQRAGLRAGADDAHQSVANTPHRGTVTPAPSQGAGWGEVALASDLLASECVRLGEFRLKSGQTSPIYLDLRRLVSHPAILRRVAHAYAELLRALEYDRIAGIPYAALPIATAVALELDKPLIYPRREVKAYGTRAAIEGDYRPGETVVVLDDLATTGETKLETIEKLTEVGLRVRDIVVLIDRGQGADAALAAAGYRLHAVTTLPQLLDAWRASQAITPEQYAAVKTFLDTKIPNP